VDVQLDHRDGEVRVKLVGDLDDETSDDERIRPLIELRRNVVIDMSEVTFIDSGGLSALIRIAALHDGPVRLVGVPDGTARLFEITGLDQVFQIA
jgi:anti-anti-sigma factor